MSYPTPTQLGPRAEQSPTNDLIKASTLGATSPSCLTNTPPNTRPQKCMEPKPGPLLEIQIKDLNLKHDTQNLRRENGG